MLLSGCDSETEHTSRTDEGGADACGVGRVKFVKIVSVETEGDKDLALSMLGAALQSHNIRYSQSTHLGMNLYVEEKDVNRALEILHRVKTLKGHWRQVEEHERVSYWYAEGETLPARNDRRRK